MKLLHRIGCIGFGLAGAALGVGAASPGAAPADVPSSYLVQYSAHVQNIGWQSPVADGATAGTVGQGLRMEALEVNVNRAVPELAYAHICANANVKAVGWLTGCDGARAGTEG